jgi:hypothetical protein
MTNPHNARQPAQRKAFKARTLTNQGQRHKVAGNYHTKQKIHAKTAEKKTLKWIKQRYKEVNST